MTISDLKLLILSFGTLHVCPFILRERFWVYIYILHPISDKTHACFIGNMNIYCSFMHLHGEIQRDL